MKGWEWRKAMGGWTMTSDDAAGERLFHAYDPENLSACAPSAGLIESIEEPNEGSKFCPDCMDVVRTVDGDERAAEYRERIARKRAERGAA